MQVQDVWLRDFEQAAFDSLSRQQEEQSAEVMVSSDLVHYFQQIQNINC